MSANTLFKNLLTHLKRLKSSLKNILNTLIDKQYPQKIAWHILHFLDHTKKRLIQLRSLSYLLAILSIKYANLTKDKTLFASYRFVLYTLKFLNTCITLFNLLINFVFIQADKAIVILITGSLFLQKHFASAKKKLGSRLNIFILHLKLALLKIYIRTSQSFLAQRLKQYALLIRLDKPIGILLLLWPTLIALWIAAGGWPDTDVLLVFIAGVFLMRSAGCAINDYADRHIDRLVTRTKNRPLTSGKITSIEALLIFAALCIAAFYLVTLMNPLTIVMSLIGLVLAASYPFMKRHHYLPQVHLGAAFGWAVPMAYAAQTNELSPVAWLLFIATVLWATAYDTMYAMVDREDDLKIGVKSTAILFEDADKLIIGIIQGILILCLIMVGQKVGLGGFYFTGVVIASVLAIWQQYLIRHRQPAECFQAFLNNNWFGLVLFVGIFLEYQLGGITS